MCRTGWNLSAATGQTAQPRVSSWFPQDWYPMSLRPRFGPSSSLCRVSITLWSVVLLFCANQSVAQSGFVDQLQRLFLWEDPQRSLRLVVVLVVTGALLYSRLRYLVQLLLLALVAALGTAALLWNALFFRTLRTCCRATLEHRRSRGRRSLSAVRSWAFFSESPQEAQVSTGPPPEGQD
mmetsp:Transcript_43019/g.96889  ORF Transcript_43019/g.96889 Transcript_43019/m.96889 type:complete len:180 (-) Transcript_43019:8-547(-)